MKLNFQVFSDGPVTYFYEVIVFKAFQWPRGLTPTATVWLSMRMTMRTSDLRSMAHMMKTKTMERSTVKTGH